MPKMVYTSSRSTFLAASFSPACRCVSFFFVTPSQWRTGLEMAAIFYFCPAFLIMAGRFDFFFRLCIIIPFVRMFFCCFFRNAPKKKGGNSVVHGLRLNKGGKTQ